MKEALPLKSTKCIRMYCNKRISTLKLKTKKLYSCSFLSRLIFQCCVSGHVQTEGDGFLTSEGTVAVVHFGALSLAPADGEGLGVLTP